MPKVEVRLAVWTAGENAVAADNAVAKTRNFMAGWFYYYFVLMFILLHCMPLKDGGGAQSEICR